MTTNSFYDQYLAYIHHTGFSSFIDNVGDQLIEIFQEKDITSGQVIDLGCGAGQWAEKLVKNNYSVLGIDLSEHMIALARKTAPQAEFKIQSIYNADLRPCAVVTALGEVLNYKTKDTELTIASLDVLFRKVATNLQKSGIFIFDIIVQSDEKPMQYRSWSKGLHWAVLVEVSEDQAKNELTRDMTIFRKKGGAYRRSQEQHRIRVWDKSEIKHLLIKHGFEVNVSSTYGSYSLAERRLAFIATKR